eukprot:scaffold16587_cov141-Isochrysis_galbana.AAC.6
MGGWAAQGQGRSTSLLVLKPCISVRPRPKRRAIDRASFRPFGQAHSLLNVPRLFLAFSPCPGVPEGVREREKARH